MNAPIRIPDGFVDELKARIRPSDIIGRKVKLKKQGKEWVGLSPFTNEKTPSFYVNDTKKIFKCFSSGMGGDVISFVMETERLSFMEAVEKLADEAGMSLPKATPQDRQEYDRRKRLFEVCDAAASFYEACLREAEGAEARRYLEGRGLGPQTWGKYRLGYSPDDWRRTIEHLKSKGFSMAEIVEAGMAVEKDGGGEPYDRFRGRLMFPIEDVRGAVIAFGGRGLQPDAKPKYLNSSDTPLFHKGRVLYRYKPAREVFGGTDEGGLIVCEGYMDVIAMCEAGFGHAVAPLGTALTEDQLTLLWRAGPEPILCFDGDRAGLGAAYRSIERALPGLQPGRSLFFCLLSDGMDPDDYIKVNGKDAMGQLLNQAIPLVSLLWQKESETEPLDTPERQAGLEQRLMSAISLIKHDGVRAAYKRDLFGRVREYFWHQRRKKYTKNEAQVVIKREDIRKIRGISTIFYILDHPEVLDHVFEQFVVADFKDEYVSVAAKAVEHLYVFNEDFVVTSFLDFIRQNHSLEAANFVNRIYYETYDSSVTVRDVETISKTLQIFKNDKVRQTKLGGEDWRDFKEHRRMVSEKQLHRHYIAEINEAS
jgi:DNA primase